MSHSERLRQWSEKAQKEEGLIDVKFYPGSSREVYLELAAQAALTLLEGSPYEEDVSEEDL